MNGGIDKLFKYESVLVIDNTMTKTCKSIIYQIHGNEKGSRTHISREKFAAKLITSLIGKYTDKGLIRFFNYRQQLLLQSGLFLSYGVEFRTYC